LTRARCPIARCRSATKPDQPTETEVRFLRKRIELTQADLAKELWVRE
jgi:hypothetical protein